MLCLFIKFCCCCCVYIDSFLFIRVLQITFYLFYISYSRVNWRICLKNSSQFGKFSAMTFIRFSVIVFWEVTSCCVCFWVFLYVCVCIHTVYSFYLSWFLQIYIYLFYISYWRKGTTLTNYSKFLNIVSCIWDFFLNKIE